MHDLPQFFLGHAARFLGLVRTGDALRAHLLANLFRHLELNVRGAQFLRQAVRHIADVVSFDRRVAEPSLQEDDAVALGLESGGLEAGRSRRIELVLGPKPSAAYPWQVAQVVRYTCSPSLSTLCSLANASGSSCSNSAKAACRSRSNSANTTASSPSLANFAEASWRCSAMLLSNPSDEGHGFSGQLPAAAQAGTGKSVMPGGLHAATTTSATTAAARAPINPRRSEIFMLRPPEVV